MGMSADEAGGDALQHALRATTQDQDVAETKIVMGVRGVLMFFAYIGQTSSPCCMIYVYTPCGADMLLIYIIRSARCTSGSCLPVGICLDAALARMF